MENVTKSYVDILEDPVFRLTADKLVLRVGVSAKFKGATTLADAVILFGTNTCRKFCTIYSIIAEHRGLTMKSVMREISYAIYSTRDIAERLSALLGIPIHDEDIHSGLVISYLGMIFKNPDLSLYS